MKPLAKLFALVVLICLTSCGKDDEVVPEKIYNGHLYLDTQAEVDEFGKLNYTRVEGELILFGDNITDISSLKGITYVKSKLAIIGTQVKNIDALSTLNIEENSTVEIFANNSLENLNGLAGITAGLSLLSISKSPSIKNIDGLRNIKSISNRLEIYDTEYLANLNGLKNIGGTINSVAIHNNSGLTDLSGLSRVSTIKSLIITANPKLKSLNGLTGLKETDSFYLSSNQALENLNALSNLETSLYLVIRKNDKLTNLDGLGKLRKVETGGLAINENKSLRNFCGLTILSSYNIVVLELWGNYYNPTEEDIKNGKCSI
ncbi:hypothetical protein [Pontibacter populi]|uniref:Receptor L-domain domain-containing protein n=1 Tax=Pontibacter populi TaxID=890055 RepID=A0ABV1RVI6_9BACT